MMQQEQYQALLRDIAENGQLEPVWTLGNQILDGRNRWSACLELGLEPITREYEGPTDTVSLVNFTISLNLNRRHLTKSQLATLAIEIEKVLAEAARERMTSGVNQYSSPSQKFDYPDPNQGKAAEQAAQIVGTNRQYVSDAKKIAQLAPDLFEEIRQGEISITDAKRELKERKRDDVRAINRELVEQTPPIVTIHDRTYQTIVIDPPWDWGDEGDQDQFGRARPTYQTMTFEEILELPIPNLSDTNAHIYLWITNRSLPKGFALLERWGFRYVTTLTWCKPSIGMGNYFRGSTEHVLFGVKGSLPLLRNDMGTWFDAPRPGRHSAKPDAFYQIVETCSPGPWLEMFSRQERNGWAAWGAEACTTSVKN